MHHFTQRLPAPIQEVLMPLTGNITAAKPVSGGCIHHALQLTTPKGHFFLKWNQAGQAHNFEVEAKGLALLREASSLTVPAVIHKFDNQSIAGLLLEWIEPGRKAPDFHSTLGEGLARLHMHTQDQFGLGYDNYIGALPQFNTPAGDWVSFFVASRLQAQLKMERASRLFTRRDRQRFESLFGKLPSRMPAEPPALIHGDLWGGNLLTGPDGQGALIDPAVYFGHREAEIAFMNLFDSYPSAFYDAYESVRPLAPGWRERIDLFNLYPLLVHVNLFGEGYVGSVKRILTQYT